MKSNCDSMSEIVLERLVVVFNFTNREAIVDPMKNLFAITLQMHVKSSLYYLKGGNAKFL